MIDPVHNAAIRIATGAFRTSPRVSLYAESGEPPLHYRRKQLALQYYYRVKQEPTSTVGKAVFKENENQNSDITFGGRMGDIVDVYGVGDLSVMKVSRQIAQ